MRKQYHFRPSERGLLAWDVDRLVELAADLKPTEVPLSDIRELDETFWYDYGDSRPTCRSVALHAQLMQEADLSHPIILSRSGRVMDGMHRVCRALIEGRTTIPAVRFEEDPEPDYVGRGPDELEY
jgi:hypothetical protein